MNQATILLHPCYDEPNLKLSHAIRTQYKQHNTQKNADKHTRAPWWRKRYSSTTPATTTTKSWSSQWGSKYERNPSLDVTCTRFHNLQKCDQFFHHAMLGHHSVMAFEVLGRSLLTIIKRFNYESVPMLIVCEIARQILMGLDYLHRACTIIHADSKPEWILLSEISVSHMERAQSSNLFLQRLVDGPIHACWA